MTVATIDDVEISLFSNTLLECLNHRSPALKEIRTIKVVCPILYSEIVEIRDSGETGGKTSH